MIFIFSQGAFPANTEKGDLYGGSINENIHVSGDGTGLYKAAAGVFGFSQMGKV